MAVSHLGSAPRGVLNVNAPVSFGVRHVGPAIPAFMARYPELSVELVLNDRVVDLVEEGFDVGIRIVRLRDSTLIARRLAPARRILCAAPDYLAVHGMPRSPEDLAEHECLLYSHQASVDRWGFTGPEGEREVRVHGRLRVNNGDALLEAAMSGLGIILLPSFICAEALRGGRLVRLLPAWTERSGAAVHAVYPANRNLSPKVRAFVDFLVERFGPAPYWDVGLDP